MAFLSTFTSRRSFRAADWELLLVAAKEESPRNLRLHVFQRNLSARRFYERRGFMLLKLRDGSSNEEGEPDAVYEWIGSGLPS
jgi:ribosomal protein S18 acetylase RimI-like enzyme